MKKWGKRKGGKAKRKKKRQDMGNEALTGVKCVTSVLLLVLVLLKQWSGVVQGDTAVPGKYKPFIDQYFIKVKHGQKWGNSKIVMHCKSLSFPFCPLNFLSGVFQ